MLAYAFTLHSHSTPFPNSSLCMKKILRFSWLCLCLIWAPEVTKAQAFVPALNHVYRLYSISNFPGGPVAYTMVIGGNATDQYQPGVAAYTSSGNNSEATRQWSFEDAGGGRFRIRNRNSQLYLEQNAQTSYNLPSDEYRAVQNYYTGDNRQVWSLEPTTTSPITYVFRNYGTGLTITTDIPTGDNTLASVVTSGTRVPPYKWVIQDVSTNPSNDYYSSYFRLTNNNSGKLLTVAQGDNTDRAVMQVEGRNRSSEEWAFTPATTSGYYYLINRRNRLVLEIGGANTDNGATVNLWENNRNPWQEWAFLDINDSHILAPYEFTDGRVMKIYSRHAGKVLEIAGGSNNNGATANMWNDFSQRWQQWLMQFSSYNRPATPLAVTASDAAPSVNIYPNPATQTLTLTAVGAFNLGASTVTLTDVRGSRIKAPYQNSQLDISALSTGLYFVTITNSQQTIRQKFTKL